MSSALVLTGSPGSGKSSVLDALSTSLEIDAIEFGAIESEQLARGWPWLALSDALPQLAAVADLQRAAGRDLFLVVATTETSLELRGVINALVVDRVLVVCLYAPPEVVGRPIAARESDVWPGKQPLIACARDLAIAIPAIVGIDVVVDTDGRSVEEVAAQVRTLLFDRDIIPTRDA